VGPPIAQILVISLPLYSAALRLVLLSSQTFESSHATALDLLQMRTHMAPEVGGRAQVQAARFQFVGYSGLCFSQVFAPTFARGGACVCVGGARASACPVTYLAAERDILTSTAHAPQPRLRILFARHADTRFLCNTTRFGLC
jgi:hypothetical protein